MRVYEEIIDFIAAGSSPIEVARYQPSAELRERVADLLARQKTDSLTHEEAADLNHYLEIEHIMRLAKARARRRIGHE